MTTRTVGVASLLADALADSHAADAAPPLSLASGAVGVALAYLVRNSDCAHVWVKTATADAVDATDRATLFHGLPALTFVLSHARPDDYAHARRTLLVHLRELAHRRTEAAHARIDRAKPLSFAEYDLVSGLTGIGVVLLRTDPDGAALEAVLGYLVRLTAPIRTSDGYRPGWWVHHDPWGGANPDFPEGHANLGMAHGIAGPLALLSLTYRFGKQVAGQTDAIRRICAALDSWRRDDPAGSWWPGWVATAEQSHPLRRPGPPSWCYGTPGLARAQQLAGLSLGDPGRCRNAEEVIAACLEDPQQQDRLTENGLCHGRAGLLQVLQRMAQDQRPRAGRRDLRRYIDSVRAPLLRDALSATGNGFLEGRAGILLALSVPEVGRSSAWDSCLLLAA